MDIEELQTFVAVADAGGISPAALRLGVAKSIVSRRLVRLEKDLGVQLLSRTTRGAALTEAGATFRDYAARVCDEIALARETIAPAGDLRGRLRIAAPLSFGPTQFGPIYGMVVASPAYIEAHGSPETPVQLLAHQALMQGTEAWQLMDGENIITVRPQGRFKADNGTALVAAALAGLGIAYLPTGLVHAHVDSGALVHVMPRHPVPPAGAYVVRPPGQHTTRKIRILTDLLVEYFENTPPNG